MVTLVVPVREAVFTDREKAPRLSATRAAQPVERNLKAKRLRFILDFSL